jgi:hypothetical protein
MNDQRILIYHRHLSKFNNGNLNTLPQIFQCSKCKKYNNIMLPENQLHTQKCCYCMNPNYIKNLKKN